MSFVWPILLAATLAARPAPPAAAQDPVAPAPPSADYTFPTGAGMLFFYVKPDKALDFESVVGRLNEVLTASEDPVRRQQAASWRIFRSVESHDDRIYVFLFDPAVGGANYDPVKILSEALPAEVQALYARLKEAIVRVERMGLAKMR